MTDAVDREALTKAVPANPDELLTAEEHRELNAALARLANTRRRAEASSRDILIGTAMLKPAQLALSPYLYSEHDDGAECTRAAADVIAAILASVCSRPVPGGEAMTATADREALTYAICGYVTTVRPDHNALPGDCYIEGSGCRDMADAILATGLLDQVRHDHGERIANEIHDLPVHMHNARTMRNEAERRARDLSKAPEDPRFDDPAHAEHIATRAEEEG